MGIKEHLFEVSFYSMNGCKFSMNERKFSINSLIRLFSRPRRPVFLAKAKSRPLAARSPLAKR